MEKSDWLTRIAKSFNSRIESVGFEPLEGMPACVYRDPEQIEAYYIMIDKDQVICPFQILHALYHEIAHVIRFDLGYMRHKRYEEAREGAADWFAFEALGMIDERGQIKPKHRACYDCMKMHYSKTCLKERAL